MSLKESGYRGLVLARLTSTGVKVGDIVRLTCHDTEYEGVLMPRSQVGSNPSHIVIKLANGYNIGVNLSRVKSIKRVKRVRRAPRPGRAAAHPAPSLPTVSILSTGGTIASRVDYFTGAVSPALTAEDLYLAVPELETFASINARVLMSRLSENIHPSDWGRIARAVATEVRKGVDGIVVAHGTDTLGFTAAALSFALEGLPVPVVLVGSQRSSDRPSSDAAMNLVASVLVAGHADAAEVMVVMHGTTDDRTAIAHRGTRVRKLHTSRRDAFQSVNAHPLYRVRGTEIFEIASPLRRRDTTRKVRVRPRFEDRVVLLRMYPGIPQMMIDTLLQNGVRGIVLEGTGLGHAPVHLHASLKEAIDSGVIVAMTSQCIHGRVNMNVYRPGVELQEMGVIPCGDMLPETALTKLMWLLANVKQPDKVCALMRRPLVGEMSDRSEYTFYTSPGGAD